MEPTKSEAVKFPLIATPSTFRLITVFNKSTTGFICPIVPTIIQHLRYLYPRYMIGVYGIIFNLKLAHPRLGNQQVEPSYLRQVLPEIYLCIGEIRYVAEMSSIVNSAPSMMAKCSVLSFCMKKLITDCI